MTRFNPLLLVLVLALSACGTLGGTVPQPQTPFERMAALEKSYQAALATLDRLIDGGLIDADDSEEVEQAVVVAGQAMRAARAAHRAGAQDQTELISAANAAVLTLINILREKELETDAGSRRNPGGPVWCVDTDGAGHSGCRAAA